MIIRTKVLKAKKQKPFDLASYIIAFEDGELNNEEIVLLFQHLVDTGMAWTLQGFYGRTAEALISAGHVKAKA